MWDGGTFYENDCGIGIHRIHRNPDPGCGAGARDIRVGALGAGSNIDLLKKQIREFRPGLAAVWEEEKARELKSRVRDTNTKIVSGMDGLLELAVLPEAELAGDGHCGNDRDPPTMAALEAGKDIALANKETLVTAGI